MFLKDMVNYVRVVYYVLQLTHGIKAASVSDKRLNQIDMSLDQTLDPCEDFYGYACNNWSEHHNNPIYTEITGQVDNQMNIQLINLMDSLYQDSYQIADQCQSFVEKTRAYYRSCLHEKERNFTRYFDHIKPGPGLEWPIIEELQAQLRGDTPVSTPESEWPNGHCSVFALLGQLQSYGLNNVLISQDIARTQNGSLQIILEVPHVTETDMIPPPAIAFLLMNLGLPKTSAMNYAMQIKQTEANYLEVYQNHSASDESEPVKLTYSEVKQAHPTLVCFLEHLMPQQIQDTDFISINNMNYFQFLLNTTWGPKKPQRITNYMMVKFLLHLLKDTTNGFTKLDCMKELRNKMDLSVNYLYYKHILGYRAWHYEQQIAQLRQDILTYYFKTLNENPLKLHANQLLRLKHKLMDVRISLGNLPSNVTDGTINEFYRDVAALDARDYYHNHLQLLRHRFVKSLLYTEEQSFFIATDNRVGSSSAPIYIPKQNLIIVPPGALQPPIYHIEYDPIFKWSMLGFLLAHEYTHAIDTVGLQYGSQDLVTVSEQMNFTASLDCMQQQEPTETIDERLADLVGARVAYNAYVGQCSYRLQPTFSKKEWKKLFFLNLAQFFCGRKDVQFVDHDADAVRLQQIVMNLESFAGAFKCPNTSRMNPPAKCRVY